MNKNFIQESVQSNKYLKTANILKPRYHRQIMISYSYKATSLY